MELFFGCDQAILPLKSGFIFCNSLINSSAAFLPRLEVPIPYMVLPSSSATAFLNNSALLMVCACLITSAGANAATSVAVEEVAVDDGAEAAGGVVLRLQLVAKRRLRLKEAARIRDDNLFIIFSLYLFVLI